jgi:hypothetical protein
LSVKVQATLLELLEGQGLPQQIAVTMALEEDAHRRLGEVMATAVKVRLAGSCYSWQVAGTTILLYG